MAADAFTVTRIADDAPDAVRIAELFRANGLRATGALAVQNDFLRDRFEQECELQRRYGRELNEQCLYHGTRGSVDAVLSQGLDERLSQQGGMFGRGIYFSAAPAKCHSYVLQNRHQCTPDTLFMLECRVLLGRVFKYPPRTADCTLVREPMGFDSIEGEMSIASENVVYTSRRVLTTFVIYYEPLPPSPPLRLSDQRRVFDSDRRWWIETVSEQKLAQRIKNGSGGGGDRDWSPFAVGSKHPLAG